MISSLAILLAAALPGEAVSFEVDAFKKHCLLNGLDDIGVTMEQAAQIDAFEAKSNGQRPWV